MKVPFSWLQTFVGAPLPTPQRVVELLDGLGLAVEGVEELPGAPHGVVVVEVLEVAAMDGSDHLKRVIVTDGTSEHQVVCGAPNVTVGMRVALALPGAVLPGLGTEPVGRREVLGVSSEGVLASPKELGLYEHSAGLIAFADDVKVGDALAGAWLPETVIELEVTPNRADAFSILGIARDLCAKLPAPLIDPSAGLPSGDPSGDDGLELNILDPKAAPRFALRAVRGVKVGPSPVWLQRRLAALGLRPRNNIVDVTNLVTFELGQPSHAYDLADLSGGALGVRRAREGEELLLLNDDQITLHPGDLVITTPEAAGGDRAVGLAGVMGGLFGGVSNDTTAVALETAYFDPVTVRRAGQRHKLVTDARTRFERGVDPNLQEVASARLAALTVEVAGGNADDALSAVGENIKRPAVEYRPSRVHFLCDFEVPHAQQRRYLTALGCGVEERGNDDWLIQPPSWRFDLGIEEDFVEEVARLHGYEHIGETVPAMHFVPPATDPTHRRLRTQLAALGFLETISYAYTGARELQHAAAPAPTVELSDPQGIERAVLRTAVYPGLLGAAQQNPQAPSLALFEIGRVFEHDEEERLSLLLRGPRELGTWRAGLPGDFYTFKGVLEQLAGLVGSEVTLEPTTAAPFLHPGVAAAVSWNGTQVGYAGQLHPAVATHYELADCFVAELRLPLAGSRIDFQPISRQQFAERDLAIIAPRDVTFAELRELCAGAAGPLLVSLDPFDVYQGDQLPSGSRSVALRFHFLAAERALTDGEVDALMGNVIQAVKGAGYDVRA